MPLALLLVLLAAADPEGTVVLNLRAGEAAPITTGHEARVICDDVLVARPEYTEDGNGFVLRAVKAGSTLCGVWLPDQMPGGLYRVNVKAASKADAGPQARGGAPGSNGRFPKS